MHPSAFLNRRAPWSQGFLRNQGVQQPRRCEKCASDCYGVPCNQRTL